MKPVCTASTDHCCEIKKVIHNARYIAGIENVIEVRLLDVLLYGLELEL